MTYYYAVRRNGLLLVRTLTRAKAEKLARKYGGGVVEEYASVPQEATK